MATHREEKAETPRRSGHWFFAPAVNILNRLKHLQKFVLISACFAVPIVVAMYLLIDRNIDCWKDFTRKEAEGIVYVSKMRKLIEDVQARRALSMMSAAGDERAGESLAGNETEVEGEMKEMDRLAEKLPDRPAKDRWRRRSIFPFRRDALPYSLSRGIRAT